MRVVPLLIAMAAVRLPVAMAAPDPVDLMTRAAAAFDVNRQNSVNYLYQEKINVRQVDKKNATVFEDSRTYEIIYLEGETYPKLIARNGKPLSRTEQQAEDAKIQVEVQRRRGKSLNDRMADRVPSKDRAQIAYHRIPELHRLRLEGEATDNGRPVWILSAEPSPDVMPQSEIDNYTHSLKMRLWIDKANLLFHRIEAVSVRGAWRRPAGNRLEVEFIPFGSTVWLVKRVYQRAPLGRDAKPAIYQDTEQVYTEFRHFQADSKLVTIE